MGHKWQQQWQHVEGSGWQHIGCSDNTWRAAVVAGRLRAARNGAVACNGVGWHTRVQVVRVVVVASDGASDPSMWVGDVCVRGAWVRERVQAGHVS